MVCSIVATNPVAVPGVQAIRSSLAFLTPPAMMSGSSLTAAADPLTANEHRPYRDTENAEIVAVGYRDAAASGCNLEPDSALCRWRPSDEQFRILDGRAKNTV